MLCRTGSIDLNEFFEIYRILEYHNAARFARRRSVSSHLLEAAATSESNVSAASPLKSDTNGTAPTLTRSRSIGGNTSLDIKGVNISVD